MIVKIDDALNVSLSYVIWELKKGKIPANILFWSTTVQRLANEASISKPPTPLNHLLKRQSNAVCNSSPSSLL